MRSAPSLAAAVLVVGLLAACGDDDGDDGAGATASSTTPEASSAEGGRPQVVVTTSILGDMVSEVLGEQADVEVIMPLGSDPHEFAASAQQAEAMEKADLLVVNGAGFEEGLADLIEAAEESGTPTFALSDNVELLAFDGEDEHAVDGEHADEEHAEEGEHTEEEHAEEEHAEEEHAEEGEHAEDGEHADEEHEHAEGSDDPHIWTDPARMATAMQAFGDRASELDGVDAAAVESQTADYVDQLNALDSEIEDTFADVPDDRRVLVTNHEVFGYFADRYGFEVIGAVIPSITTNASASAADLEELAAVIRERQVPAIFGETTQPTQLAEALAAEAGSDVEVVELFTESLGEDGSGAETYVGMMRTNADRISSALA